MPSSRRARSLPALGLLIALLVAATPLADTAAAREAPTTIGRQVIAPFMGNETMPNRALVTDRSGVVLASYGGTLGNQYNPVTISQAAITFYYAAVHSGESPAQKRADRRALLVQANWLVKNQDASGRWPYHFPFNGQPVPWYSAMAQGLGMSALLRAFAIAPDVAYVNAIAKAGMSFRRDWAHAGVSSWQRVATRRYLVYEEYMAPYSPHTLNGWIFSLAGLWEVSHYLGDTDASRALSLPDRGFAALKALLPYYDTGNWSTYNLTKLGTGVNGRRATVGYHGLHVRQLRWVAKVTGDGVFTTYANRFQRYLDTCTAAGKCPP